MLFANPRAVVDDGFRGATDGKTLKRMVIRHGADSGVEGPHLPHRWRHRYATHLLRGVHIAVVQQLLGRSSITTTSFYLHLMRDDLLAGADQAFR